MSEQRLTQLLLQVSYRHISESVKHPIPSVRPLLSSSPSLVLLTFAHAS